MIASHRWLGLTLAAGILAVAGMPPFGLFASEFLIVTETVRRMPVLGIPLGLGLLVGAWALVSRLITLCLGPAAPSPGPAPELGALAPALLHLGVVLALGLAMPSMLVAWFSSIAGEGR